MSMIILYIPGDVVLAGDCTGGVRVWRNSAEAPDGRRSCLFMVARLGEGTTGGAKGVEIVSAETGPDINK